MSVVEALASGHTLALILTILAYFLRCLAKMTLHKIHPHQSGPLWVFQLWLQVYFITIRPELASFSPTKVLDLQVASRPVPHHQAEDVFRYFFSLDALSDDEFLICRGREYPLSIKLPTSAWSADDDADLRQSWRSFVLTRDLPLGCDAHRASSRSLKKAEVIAPAAAGKKSTIFKRVKTTTQALLSKQPRQEAKKALEPLQPVKRVKKLARKGEREIHVISSQTTGAKTPSISPSTPVVQALTEKRPISTKETAHVRPVFQVVRPVVAPLVEASAALRPTVTSVLEGTAPLAEKNLPENPKPTAGVLEESDMSNEIPLTSHLQPRDPPSPVSKAVVQVGPSAVDLGK
ncbi:hypothetical protein ACFXTI_031948 [Malus domestica]